MIIIPVNTDAPIYHWPWMTLVLVFFNVVVFFVTGQGAEPDGWLLQYGQGLRPAEWFACNFLHFGWMHLIGNMIFLWAFGMIVEGKLGWWRFLLMYLLLGGLGGFIEQLAMLGYKGDGPPGSGGASLCVYGLLAICAVWAPKNEITCWLLLGFRVIDFDVSLLTLGLWYIGIELLSAWWTGFRISSAMLHLTGAAVGIGIGVAFLKLRWVDCENWDLFALWGGRLGQPVDHDRWQDNIEVTHAPGPGGDEAPSSKKPKKKATFRPSIYLSSSNPRRRKPATSKPPDTPPDDTNIDGNDVKRTLSESALPAATLKVLDRMRELIRDDKPQAALAEYRKRLRIVDHWKLDADDLQAIANGMFKRKNWDEAIPLLEEFVQRFPAQADAARIKLAAIFCEVQTRPRAALKLLDQVELDDLPDSLRQHIAQIRQKAEGMINDDTFELEGQSW